MKTQDEKDLRPRFVGRKMLIVLVCSAVIIAIFLAYKGVQYKKCLSDCESRIGGSSTSAYCKDNVCRFMGSANP